MFDSQRLTTMGKTMGKSHPFGNCILDIFSTILTKSKPQKKSSELFADSSLVGACSTCNGPAERRQRHQASGEGVYIGVEGAGGKM